MNRSSCFLLPLSLVFTLAQEPSQRTPVPAPEPGDVPDLLREQIERQESAFSLQGPGLWSAPNRSQDLRINVRRGAVELTPRSTPAGAVDSDWRLELSWTGWGRAETGLESVLPVDPISSGSRIEFVRGQSREWYINGSSGLEQGWTLNSSPAGPGDLVLQLSVATQLSPRLAQDRQSVRFLRADGQLALNLDALHVHDADGRELPSHFELCDGGLSIAIDDRQAKYPLEVDPLLSSAVWTKNGDQAGCWYGNAAVTAGDVNGDGYSDVVVGASYYDSGQVDEGAAFLYSGSASGLATTPSWTGQSNYVDANYGATLAPAGDVNGDGYDDLLVGAPNYANGDGRAYLYLGSASGLSASASWTFTGPASEALFANSMAGAGDVNKDGFSDVIIGTIDSGSSDVGRARVFLGQAGSIGLSASPVASLLSPSGEMNGVAGAGDVNADGYDDVLIGARGYGTGNQGWAGLHYGQASGVAATPAWQFFDLESSSYFGGGVCPAGDVNADGFADIAAPNHSAAANGVSRGNVRIFHGSAAGLPATPNTTLQGLANYEFLGKSVNPAGDVDGDGYADLLVSSQAFAHLYLGSPSGVLPSQVWTTPSSPFYSFGTAGDVDGDGFSDVIVGNSKHDGAFVDAGQARLYLGSPKGIGATPDWTREANQASASFGATVAAVDFNNDGCSDLVVGAPLYDNGQPNEGAVFVYLGSGTGPSASPIWIEDSDVSNRQFGFSLAAAGDVDGDGYPDLVVGSPYFGNTHTQEGSAWLFRGGPTAIPAATSWLPQADQNYAYLGWSVAGAGDVNGDGFSDLILGAPNWDGGQTDEGGAFVYLGSASGPSATPSWTGQGNQGSSRFGCSVSSAGDVNGDGFGDVIVGASDFNGPTVNEGRAFIYLGSAGGLATSAVWTMDSDSSGAKFGSAVACAGDVNADGLSDVVIGAPYETMFDTQEGVVRVYWGMPGGASAFAMNTIRSNQAYARFGAALGCAGDVDGDGRSDLWIGASYWDGGSTNEGALFVVPGGSNYYVSRLESDQVGAQLGTSAAAADFTGDGRVDLAVGAPLFDAGQTDEGAVRVHAVNRGRTRIPLQWRSDNSGPIAALGTSSSSSSFSIHLRGSSAAGRADMRLEWETKPVGTAFDGSSVQLGNWTLTGYPSATHGSKYDFSRLSTGLASGTLYRWRARAATRNPLFPRTPWYTLGGLATNELTVRTAP